MANCFVLRANSVIVSVEDICILRGHYGDDKAIALAKSLLNDGSFRMIPQGKLGDVKDAESVFDAMNTCGDCYMTPGDVIVWNNGKRELCLSEGWATI